MPNGLIIKLAEALASIGLKIDAFKYLHDYNFPYRNVELLLFPLFDITTFLSKDKMIQMVESLASAVYAIVKFEFNCEFLTQSIRLILYSLPENTKT
jgi:hypothetical protein